MALETQMLERLSQSVDLLRTQTTALEEIQQTLNRQIALGEEQLRVQNKQLETTDTQSLIAFMQLSMSMNLPVDPTILQLVRTRLGL